MTGVTLTEIAESLGIEKWAVEKRLRKAGIKPLTREALYPETAIEAIRNVPGKGRPRTYFRGSVDTVQKFMIEQILWRMVKKIKTISKKEQSELKKLLYSLNSEERQKLLKERFPELIKEASKNIQDVKDDDVIILIFAYLFDDPVRSYDPAES